MAHGRDRLARAEILADATLKARLETRAKAEDRSFGELVRELLSAALVSADLDRGPSLISLGRVGATSSKLPLQELAARHGLRLPHITAARMAALERRKALERAISAKRLVPVDTAFVVFGSLARGEWTKGSDLDWSLLIDGQADSAHLTAAQEIRRTIEKARYKQPGPDQLFGGLAISHQLIHLIGGEADSNRNITQRILLLLESVAPDPADQVRERVLRALLTRYLEDDFGHSAGMKRRQHVPRFLLNDIVRYWRTMAVDFAAKRRLREGKGWALRNFKLRMSRKLIFSAGLAACLSCALRPADSRSRRRSSEADRSARTAEHLLQLAGVAPLDVVARLGLEFGAKPTAVRDLFGSYDAFLGIIGDEAKRNRLDSLGPDEAVSDSLFLATKDVGNTFQDGLTALFFRTDKSLADAALRYGVF